MEVIVNGATNLTDPRTRVLAIESAVKAICEHAGLDAADGVMVLLTAAAHIARQNQKPGTDINMSLAYSLGSAIVAADDFFKPKLAVANQG